MNFIQNDGICLKTTDKAKAKWRKNCCLVGAGALVVVAITSPFDRPAGDAVAISVFCRVLVW